MPSQKNEKRFKVAIIGAGPAGLSAAIELAKLPFTDWDLYEKRPEISEIGGGLSLQPQTWRLLEHNGTADNIKPKDYYRSVEGQIEERRNGRTGEVLIKKYNLKDVPPNHQSSRITRTKLQGALLKNVDQTRLHLSMRLVGVNQLSANRVRISFENGIVDEVDLLIAADGIRSLIRKLTFPNHIICYNGQSVYRTIVSKAEAAKIKGISWAPTFWKHVSGLYVYTCPLGDDDFEVTARIRPRDKGYEPVSWGRPFDLHTLLHEYNDFCLPVRQVLQLAAEGDTQEFALFSGPRLKRIISHGNIAFIGDAAHALRGNFGSGAGFALEDVYTLTKSLDWAWTRERSLADGLELFDSIRSPHYERIYKLVDEFARIKAEVRVEDLSIDDEIATRVRRISLASESWMYYYEINKVVNEALREADKEIASKRVEQVGFVGAKKEVQAKIVGTGKMQIKVGA